MIPFHVVEVEGAFPLVLALNVRWFRRYTRSIMTSGNRQLSCRFQAPVLEGAVILTVGILRPQPGRLTVSPAPCSRLCGPVMCNCHSRRDEDDPNTSIKIKTSGGTGMAGKTQWAAAAGPRRIKRLPRRASLGGSTGIGGGRLSKLTSYRWR